MLANIVIIIIFVLLAPHSSTIKKWALHFFHSFFLLFIHSIFFSFSFSIGLFFHLVSPRMRDFFLIFTFSHHSTAMLFFILNKRTRTKQMKKKTEKWKKKSNYSHYTKWLKHSRSSFSQIKRADLLMSLKVSVVVIVVVVFS